MTSDNPINVVIASVDSELVDEVISKGTLHMMRVTVGSEETITDDQLLQANLNLGNQLVAELAGDAELKLNFEVSIADYQPEDLVKAARIIAIEVNAFAIKYAEGELERIAATLSEHLQELGVLSPGTKTVTARATYTQESEYEGEPAYTRHVTQTLYMDPAGKTGLALFMVEGDM